MPNESTPPALAPLHEDLPGAFALIHSGIRRYTDRLGIYIGMGAIVFVISTVLPALAASLEGVVTPSPSTIAVLVLSAIVYVICLLWVSLAYLHLIRGHSEQISLGEALKRAWRQVLSFIWLSICTCFILLGATLLIAGVPALLIGLLGGGMFAVFYGAVAAVVVLIIFTLWGTFSNWLLVDGEHNGIRAYAASRDLVHKAGFGSVLWRVLAISLILGLISSLLYIVPLLLGAADDNVIVNGVAELILCIVLWPMYLNTLFTFYQSVRARAVSPEPNQTSWFSGIAIAGIVLLIVLPLIGGYFFLSKLGPILEAFKSEIQAELQGP